MLVTIPFTFYFLQLPRMCIKITHSMIWWAWMLGKTSRHASYLFWGWEPYLFFFSCCGLSLIKWPFKDDSVIVTSCSFLSTPDPSHWVLWTCIGWDLLSNAWISPFPLLIYCHLLEHYLQAERPQRLCR